MTTVQSDPPFELLPVWCPIEPAIHPQADQIRKRTVEWLDAFPFYRDDVHRAWMVAFEGGEAFSRIYPEGITDRVLLSACWVQWVFILDDTRFDVPAEPVRTSEAVEVVCRVLRCMEAPEDPALGHGPFAEALRDIMASLHRWATPVQVHRLVDAHRQWLLPTLWNHGTQERGIMPDLNTYTVQRLASCGGWPTIAFSEITRGGEIPGSELYSPAVRAATEASFLVMGWDNDFLSYRRESLDRNHHNIINVLAHHNRCSAQQALADAVAMRDRAMNLFLHLREQLRPSVSLEMRGYLDDLCHAIRSNLDWGATCARYTSLNPRSEPPEASPSLTLTWAQHPSDASHRPLPIPAAAWWWKQ
jgi:Terpene synthase family 2, C-terminal metal binding